MMPFLGLCIMMLAIVSVYGIHTWRSVRMAQLTDSSVRAEWTDYRSEVNGAIDELVRQVGAMRDSVSDHGGRIQKLEADDRHTGFKRVAGVVR